MADEIQVQHYSATGKYVYTVIVNDDPDSANFGKWWNTNSQTWETMVVANWSEYFVQLAETPASSYRYVGSFPAACGFGWYFLALFAHTGGGGGISDAAFETRHVHWDGAKLRDEIKSLSQILSFLAGKQIHVPATGVTTNYHRDGTTIAATQTLTGGGNRNAPTLP
jgi:hypothetical protein